MSSRTRRLLWLGIIGCVCIVAAVGYRNSRKSEIVSQRPRTSGVASHQPVAPGAPACQLEAYTGHIPYPNQLPEQAMRLLNENGFVVLTEYPSASVLDYFHTGGNTFITADAVLYVFGSLFQAGLQEYESEKLIPATRKLVKTGVSAAEDDYKERTSQQGLAEPARRNLLFFAVAAELLGETVPRQVAKEARELAGKVRRAEEAGYYPDEDFTIYRVRGDYAMGNERADYFRAIKWLSRQILPIIPGNKDDPHEADIKLRQAVLLGLLIRADKPLRRQWQYLYNELAFFVGRPDSFTPLELIDVADMYLFPNYAKGRQPYLGTDDALSTLRRKFEKAEYPASAIMPVPQWFPGDLPSKYVQFLGERYIVDGQIMQETVFPYVPHRLLASGLDVAATLLASDRAMAHLQDDIAEHPPLAKQLRDLRGKFADVGEVHYDSLYEGWISALRKAVCPPQGRVPAFMKHEAWQDKCLNTALASWAQMRHAFLLYAKEPMTPAAGGMEVLVEPVPEFYRRVELLAQGLHDRGFVGMQDLSLLCHNLRICAEAELVGEDIPWDHLAGRAGEIQAFGQWLLHHFTNRIAHERPALVADVMTDSNTYQVLHAATGPLYPIWVIIEDDPYYAGSYMGFVMSYYEFATDDFYRMTDDEWVKTINAGKHRQCRPAWTDSFMFPASTR